MGTRGEDWSEQEMLRTLAFYVSLNGHSHKKSELSRVTSRMPNRDESTVNLRLSNYIARDPMKAKQGLKGMVGSGKKSTDFVVKYLREDGTFDVHKLLRDCSEIL
jgi:hypothetical protein